MYVQAGAGIVYDSDPASEQQECVNKAKALFRAAEEAERNTLAGSERTVVASVHEDVLPSAVTANALREAWPGFSSINPMSPSIVRLG